MATDHSTYELAAAANAELDKIKSLLNLCVSAASDPDEVDLCGALEIVYDAVLKVSETVETIEKQAACSSSAFRRWYPKSAAQEYPAGPEGWNPKLIDYIDQTADRIGELSKDFAKEKLIGYAADRQNYEVDVDAVISWMQQHTYGVRPFIICRQEMVGITASLHLGLESFQGMLAKFSALEVEHIPQKPTGLIREASIEEALSD